METGGIGMAIKTMGRVTEMAIMVANHVITDRLGKKEVNPDVPMKPKGVLELPAS